MSATPPANSVLTCAELGAAALTALFDRYGLRIEWVRAGEAIPGSHWGDSEAGLIGATLLLRADTPVHSALHEGGHYICMSPKRRAVLHTNAGGTRLEEEAVCYLQVLLADQLPGFGRARSFADMDAWGYNFCLGSAQAWFEQDAAAARAWLIQQGLIDTAEQPTWRLCGVGS